MKVFLLHPDHDLDMAADLPPNYDALIQDLELDTILSAMSADDQLVYEVASRVLLSSLTDVDEIVYRQRVLADCLDHRSVVSELYGLAGEALDSERKARTWWLMRDSPEAVLDRSVKVLELLRDHLRRLRVLAETHMEDFASPGFHRLFATLSTELDDAYLAKIGEYIEELNLRQGVLMSAALGRGMKAIRFVMHRPPQLRWLDRVLHRDGPGYTFQIPDRDESGFRALGEIRGRGINATANTLAQSADHVLGFFTMLRTELAFYIGCLNLHDRLIAKAEPACIPVPLPVDSAGLSAQGLYEPALTLRVSERVVGNDVDADGKTLVMVTGANQGGKSTFLRSVGVAQLMMQAGMFVAASSYRAGVANGVFTHFKRDEDATMTSGKLDEELARMSEIADHLRAGSMLLCNESFASTNESEGSEIGRQLIRALTEAGVRVVFVTHLFDLAHCVYQQQRPDVLFLRADRQRTYRLGEAEPLPTSYGKDSYAKVFGNQPQAGLAQVPR